MFGRLRHLDSPMAFDQNYDQRCSRRRANLSRSLLRDHQPLPKSAVRLGGEFVTRKSFRAGSKFTGRPASQAVRTETLLDAQQRPRIQIFEKLAIDAAVPAKPRDNSQRHPPTRKSPRDEAACAPPHTRHSSHNKVGCLS